MKHVIHYDRNYARIKGGKIVEFPFPNEKVTQELLESGTVKLVEEETKPTLDRFHKATRRLKMVAGVPVQAWEVELMTAREFVDENYTKVLTPYFHHPRLDIASIPSEVFKQMVQAVLDLGTMELDRFAQTRGYDGIVSLVSYKGDMNPRFNYEGTRGMELRSRYWSVLTEFNEAIVSGQREFPRTTDEIVNMFPVLTWE